MPSNAKQCQAIPSNTTLLGLSPILGQPAQKSADHSETNLPRLQVWTLFPDFEPARAKKTCRWTQTDLRNPGPRLAKVTRMPGPFSIIINLLFVRPQTWLFKISVASLGRSGWQCRPGGRSPWIGSTPPPSTCLSRPPTVCQGGRKCQDLRLYQLV